jgi:2-keto-4-pentenoate hydratase
MFYKLSLVIYLCSYTEEEVWDAVDVVAPAIEIVGSRFGAEALAQASGIQKISDFGLNDRCRSVRAS